MGTRTAGAMSTATLDLTWLTLEESQRLGIESLTAMERTLGDAIEEAKGARSPAEWLALFSRLSTGELAHLMRLQAQWLGLAFTLHDRSLNRAQHALSNAVTGAMQPDDAGVRFDSPYAPLFKVQSAWMEMMAQWTDTLRRGPMAS